MALPDECSSQQNSTQAIPQYQKQEHYKTAKDLERHKSDLYTRPGWVDATLALEEVDQARATGDRGVLWVKSKLQEQLYSLGQSLDTHAGKVLFVGVLVIATFCVGLKSATFHSDIEQLWAQPLDQEDSPPPEVLSTHQMVIQTAVNPDASVLHTSSMLDHLALIKRATKVTVNMYDITWRLKDICALPSVPQFEAHYIDQLFENMMPCTLITPLDCFWEGSKLLGPELPVTIPFGIGNNVTWTNLNPVELMATIKAREPNFDYHSLEEYFRRAGITTAYQQKPCLNPADPDCPRTAVNKKSDHPVDVGKELTSGCRGFAARYMNWPADLIVGGVVRSNNGTIQRARALQTVVQLMGEEELYDFYHDSYKVHHIGWSKEKASMVLAAWQRRFAQEVEHLSNTNFTSSYEFFTFSTATLNKRLREHSLPDGVKLSVVFLVCTVYSWMMYSALGSLGVALLVALTAAGLGVCSLIGLPMNILSIHVLPYVAVGLSLHHLFLLLTVYQRHAHALTPAQLIQRTGPTLLSGTVTAAAVLLCGAVFPVQALRVFCAQCAVCTAVNGAGLLLLMPTLVAIEARCRPAAMPCCWRPHQVPDQSTSQDNSPAYPSSDNNNDVEYGTNLLSSEFVCSQSKTLFQLLLRNHLNNIVFQPFARIILCILYAIFVCFCVLNGLRVEYDVRLSSFLPKATQEYQYLEHQNQYFGFYNFYLVTTDLEYPLSQSMLQEYHNSLSSVSNVLKDSNGGLDYNNFWLGNFRDFLNDLQEEFDRSRSQNCFTTEKWFPNATEKAVLAFKLLAQTGVVESPVDKSQIFKKKLVENDIIGQKAFYNLLTVWNSYDEFSYASSQANFQPKPFRYESSKSDYDLKIPKSQPLTYAQMPFYLKNLTTTGKIVEALRQIHSISASFNERGLKNYPVGLIFSYFNQFLLLDRLLLAQFLLTVAATCLVGCVLIQWTKLWCPVVSSVVALLPFCLMNVNALTGTMGAMHFVVVVRNAFLVTSGFLSALGSRKRRILMSLELYGATIIKGDIGLALVNSVLVLSKFEFVQCHMVAMMGMSLLMSLMNTFVLVPVVLSLVGPRSEVECAEHGDRISTPPPRPSRIRPRSRPRDSEELRCTEQAHSSQHSAQQSQSHCPKQRTATAGNGQRVTQRVTQREPSLTTITEESCNNQSIVLEPQLTVEYNNTTAKVTATANIKVEVVTPARYAACACSAPAQPSCSRTRKDQCKCCNGCACDITVNYPNS